MKTQQVVILAGGKGMRLHELTYETPKALAPIANRPIIWHIMQHYAAGGVHRFIVCVGAHGNLIAEYLDKLRSDWEIVVSDAGTEATKSQRIGAILPLIEAEHFMLTYGDDLCDVDIARVEQSALDSGSIVTLTAVRPQSPFGVLELSADGAVHAFAEKRRAEHWINGGYMVVDKRIADYLHLGEFEQEVFAALITANKLRAWRHTGFWQAMNTYKDYVELNEVASQGLWPSVATKGGARSAVGK